MSGTLRRKIDAAIDAVVAADESEEYRVAESVLATQTTDVIYSLATAALVDAARQRRRGAALSVEREAVKSEPRPRRSPEAAWTSQMEHYASMAAPLRRIIDEYAEALKIEWTADLLASEFALPDGSRTTWGDASIAQHRARVEMFTSNAQANIEGAARHEKAIAELEAAGTPTLADLVMAAL